MTFRAAHVTAFSTLVADQAGGPPARPRHRGRHQPGPCERDLPRRLGGAPMRRLFEVLSGSLAQPRAHGVRFGPYRTVFSDGCRSIKIPGAVQSTSRVRPVSVQT
ncbi:hypothetical protein FHX81_2314 [Saccharothrix saharensis]|uniref:Uncharacterized protein n=1 Tax=Saccharothrix saharensis TaxID=571190 RepID=A0A543JB53_9PSEU|nr:hypothetical protein FHX81_2314 [Saccharothrix saharensis]